MDRLDKTPVIRNLLPAKKPDLDVMLIFPKLTCLAFSHTLSPSGGMLMYCA
jgi:hypothetical protein